MNRTKTRERFDARECRRRAATSAGEYRRTLTSLSSGSLAIFLLALTDKIEPPLTAAQQRLLLACSATMSIAALLGISGWLPDGRCVYAAGRVADRNAKGDGICADLWAKHLNRWHRAKRFCDLGLPISFCVRHSRRDCLCGLTLEQLSLACLPPRRAGVSLDDARWRSHTRLCSGPETARPSRSK
jgi:hypothetical protein